MNNELKFNIEEMLTILENSNMSFSGDPKFKENQQKAINELKNSIKKDNIKKKVENF